MTNLRINTLTTDDKNIIKFEYYYRREKCLQYQLNVREK
jgi:hypothetical protein